MVCRKPATAITFLASALAALGVGAEEQLTPMVVTASRIEQSTLDAPSNVTVVTKDSLEASGAVRVGDALTAKVPSLYMRGGTGSSSRLNSTPIVSMRGQYNRVKMMVDTGASFIALTDADARALGVKPERSAYTYALSTANGVVRGAQVRLREVRLGEILVRDVEAVVLPAGALRMSLLGTSFLRRLSGYEVQGGRMVLRG